MLIYKVFRSDEMAAFLKAGETAGAPIDLADGYVHLSNADQLAGTLAKHFTGQPDLTLLAIEADALGPDLRWEVSRGDALFPHLYRKLRADDVLWYKPLVVEDGLHQPGDLTERAIYKIWTADEWATLDDPTAGSALDRADGFIHFSESQQVARVLAHFFAGQDGLKLSTVRAVAADPALKWEDAGNGELFPHLYRPLRRCEIAQTVDIPLRDGTHEVPL